MLKNIKEQKAALWSPIITFISLFFTAVISYRATSQLIENNKSVVHTHQIIEELMLVTNAVREAESQKRGFILTNQARFLNDYNESLTRVDTHLQSLKSKITDNLFQARQVIKLEQIVRERLRILNEVLTVYREHGFQEGRQALINSQGHEKMEEVSALAFAILRHEESLLAARSLQLEASSAYALNSFMIGWLTMAVLVFLSYLLLVKDLKQRKKINQTLLQANEILEQRIAERTVELKRSNRELQEFAFIASHDLQEPLRKIQVFGDRLKDKAAEKLDSTSLDYLDRMQNAALRMTRLINDLLSFSRVSIKQDPWQEVDLNKIAEDVKTDLEGSLAYYQGHLTLHTLPTITADPLQIRQLLQNIISNGLKFHQPNKSAEVSISWFNQTECEAAAQMGKKPDYYTIAIKDNGIGIEPQHIEKIFAPFQRLHSKQEYEGTGIGLAVCRKIIERHQGIIEVRSALNEGCIFLISFPGVSSQAWSSDCKASS
jgi:signal transduction histidine kinase